MRQNNLDIQRIEVKEMTENARKIFDMLGVEPNERFKIKGDEIFEEIYYFGENLCVYGEFDGLTYINILFKILNGTYQIIKLPKEPKKKKLRDLTPVEWDEWKEKKCLQGSNCEECIFNKVHCHSSSVIRSWINNKDLYSDKFLNQEIEV